MKHLLSVILAPKAGVVALTSSCVVPGTLKPWSVQAAVAQRFAQSQVICIMHVGRMANG